VSFLSGGGNRQAPRCSSAPSTWPAGDQARLLPQLGQLVPQFSRMRRTCREPETLRQHEYESRRARTYRPGTRPRIGEAGAGTIATCGVAGRICLDVGCHGERRHAGADHAVVRSATAPHPPPRSRLRHPEPADACWMRTRSLTAMPWALAHNRMSPLR